MDKLWCDTYIIGGEHSHHPSIKAFGEAFQETVKLLAEDVDMPTEEYPVSKYFLGDLYGRFTGQRGGAMQFCRHYMSLFKGLYTSISKKGYDPERSTINVNYLKDGELVLADGHKRLAIVKGLGEQSEVLAALDDKAGARRLCDELVESGLTRNGMTEDGDRMLYQPITGYEWCSGPRHTESYRKALEAIMGFCGPVQGETILDVGSCYGYFCYELTRRGAYTIGVDNDQERITLSQQLSRIYGLDWSNPKFLAVEILDYISETGLRFDCTLMLNVLHNMLGVDEESAWAALSQVAEKSGKVVLSMSHISPRRYCGTQQDIPELIMRHSSLNNYKQLGVINGRQLYGFWRS